MNLNLIKYYLFILARLKIRLIELIFWPFYELFLWGVFSLYLKDTFEEKTFLVILLVSSIIFWLILYRSTQGLIYTLYQDINEKAIINILLAPISTSELVYSLIGLSLIQLSLTVVILAILGKILFAFSIFFFSTWLIYFIAALVIFGLSTGLVFSGLLILFRYKISFIIGYFFIIIQPFCCVFYPRASLPFSIKTISYLMPASYIFETMRSYIFNNRIIWTDAVLILLVNMLYFLLAVAFFCLTLNYSRKKGLLVRY